MEAALDTVHGREEDKHGSQYTTLHEHGRARGGAAAILFTSVGSMLGGGGGTAAATLFTSGGSMLVKDLPNSTAL